MYIYIYTYMYLSIYLSLSLSISLSLSLYIYIYIYISRIADRAARREFVRPLSGGFLVCVPLLKPNIIN